MYTSPMNDEMRISILSVKLDGGDGLIVTFSDETTGAYVVEELLELRPVREQIEKPKNQIPRQIINAAESKVDEQ
jgi:hypothetical protein